MVLPGAETAVGTRHKLAEYSLNTFHPEGGPKARGFALILGITIEDVDYLEDEIRAGILMAPIKAVDENHPYGFKCVIDFPFEALAARSIV
jgi:hypothetical protein